MVAQVARGSGYSPIARYELSFDQAGGRRADLALAIDMCQYAEALDAAARGAPDRSHAGRTALSTRCLCRALTWRRSRSPCARSRRTAAAAGVATAAKRAAGRRSRTRPATLDQDAQSRGRRARDPRAHRPPGRRHARRRRVRRAGDHGSPGGRAAVRARSPARCRRRAAQRPARLGGGPPRLPVRAARATAAAGPLHRPLKQARRPRTPRRGRALGSHPCRPAAAAVARRVVLGRRRARPRDRPVRRRSPRRPRPRAARCCFSSLVRKAPTFSRRTVGCGSPPTRSTSPTSTARWPTT